VADLYYQGVYKAVRVWSLRTLEKAGDRVMDVSVDDGDDEEEPEPTSHDEKATPDINRSGANM
jgi:hypothetical protein